MTDFTSEARSRLFPVRCACCRETCAHSYYFSSDEVLCLRCTSPQPRVYRGDWLTSGARLLRFALEPRNLFLAPNLVAAALAHREEHFRHRRVEPLPLDLDLSQLEITI